MPREKDDAALLWDMMDAAQFVQSMVSEMTFEQYQADRKTKRAVEREIEIIGEAARSISETLQAAHPEIPWAKIMGQRHKLAHDYGEIEDEIIWKVATYYIPELIGQLKDLIPAPPPS